MRLGRHGAADMTEGPIWRHLIRFAVPMMIGMLFQQLYNTVDTIIVGQFVGKAALAAVGSTSPIINTLVGFAVGLASGGTVVISQSYGAHDYPALGKAVHTAVALTLILSVVLTALGAAIVTPLLHMMGTPEDVFAEAHTYLTIYFSGMLGLLVYNMGSGILRAVGDSTRPLYFLIFSAVVNTALDLLFVVAFDMGVAGVAWATLIAQACSAVLVLWVLTRDHAPYGIRWKELCLDKAMFKRICALGLPSGIQQALTSFSNVFVQASVNAFGSACMAGWSAYNKLDVFLTVPIQSISLASTTMVGQNVGAKKLDRVKAGVRQAQWMSISVTMTLAVVMVIFAPQLLRMFSSESDVLEYGVYFVRFISPFYALMCFTNSYAGALRGIGRSQSTMYICLFSFVAFRQLYLQAGRLFGSPLPWVTLAYPVGWMMAAALLGFWFYRSLGQIEKQMQEVKV